jgi:membrane-bound lytic murein transglycosylase B
VRARAAVAAVALVLVAACGNGSDSADTTAPQRTGVGHGGMTTSGDAGSQEVVVTRPEQLVAARSAQQLARTLTRVERGLRDPATTPDDARVLGWEQQLAYRTAGNHRDWEPALLAALPADVQPVVASMIEAGRSLAPLVEPQAALPDWRIEPPPPPEQLVAHYREAEAASGVPWPYLAAIHFVETRMGRIRGTSTAGAQGPMQFIPATWDAFGEGDVNDNRDAILAAGRYLASRGAPTDMSRALYSYNNSDDYVDSVQRYADLVAAGGEPVYRGFYHWQVYYATTTGLALLPEGYPTTPAVYLPPA